MSKSNRDATYIKNKIFDVSIFTFMIGMLLISIVPMIHILAISLSESHYVQAGMVRLLPVSFNVKAYEAVLRDQTMVNKLFYTIFLTALYTAISLTMSVMLAYPLTKKSLKGRNMFLTLIVITMYVSGGLIPDYLLYRQLRLIDTIWVLILPGMISTFNMIILKTYFSTSIPESLEESAYLDGCSHIGILVKIILPLSKPVLATIALFYAVSRWNGFMDGLFFINTKYELQPLQVKLYQIIANSMSIELANMEGLQMRSVATESVKAACILFATVPILVVYPFLQKYFVSGMMIGAIKG